MSFCQDIYNMLCRKYPNSNIYLLSDHHFCHNNIINYTRTEFSDINAMHERIIEEHNKVVGEDDIIIFLGDFSFKNSYVREVLNKLNGHKFLILGNHDQQYIVKSYPTFGFEGVYTTPIRLNGDYLSHEPLVKGERLDQQFKLIVQEFAKCSNSMNYHGHIHTDFRLDSEHYTNVTCEAMDYKPLLIGRTKPLESKETPLFINDDKFAKYLDEEADKYHINARVLLKDYLYSYILDCITDYNHEFFIQGSFGLYKKYGFVSDFSDIDISFLYNINRSKNVNIAHMKTLVDKAFASLTDIDNINLAFVKRYSSLRILEALYTSKNPYCVKCYVDSNLVFLDSYRESDFLTLEGHSTLGNILKKEESSIIDEYNLPEFSAKVIIPEADMANLILQILFQKDLGPKKTLILKKLQYIYKMKFPNGKMKDFQDIFTRFFLRNICLLHALHRYDEIAYIQKSLMDFPYLLEILPINIREIINTMLEENDNLFMDTYSEISKVKPDDTLEKSSELMKKIK